MLKVLVLATCPDFPEVKYLAGLATLRAGSESQMQIKLLTEREPSGTHELRAAGVEVQQLHFGSTLTLGAISRVKSELKKWNPHVVLALSTSSLAAAVCAKKLMGSKVRLVGYRGTIGKVSPWSPYSRLTYLSSEVNALICVCNSVRDSLHELSPRAELRTIYKGHDPAWYQAAPRSAYDALGIDSKAILITCVAKVRPKKGVDLLVEAFERIPISLHARLVIIGSVDDHRVMRLISGSPRRDRIHILGYREDAIALLGASDLAVMPSRAREGLPKSVLEAMALGVPLIVSDSGGNRELIEDRRSGRVVRAGDLDALSAALLEYLENPALRRLFADEARRRLLQHFSIQQTVEQVGNLLTGLASDAPL